jgi:hypothetical protein
MYNKKHKINSFTKLRIVVKVKGTIAAGRALLQQQEE